MPASTFARVVASPKNVWGLYLKRIQRRPIQTKMTTSVIAAALGDALAQKSSSKHPNQPHDWARTARLCLFNSLMGCFGHFYYGAMDAKVMAHAPRSALTVATKVFIDQLLFSPVCTAVFYLYKCLSEGRLRDYPKELETKYWTTLKAGWTLWPAAHVVNFALVPTEQRILYMNVVSIAGNFILSRAAAGDLGLGAGDQKKGEIESRGGLKERMGNERVDRGEMLLDMNVKMD